MQGATWARWYPYVCWQYLSFPILDVTARDMYGHICCLRKMGSYTPTPDWPAGICLNISYISFISQVSSTPVPSHGLSQDTATGSSHPHKILSFSLKLKIVHWAISVLSPDNLCSSGLVQAWLLFLHLCCAFIELCPKQNFSASFFWI